MRIYFEIIFFILFLLNNSSFGKNAKIIGGFITEIRHFPYTISLRTYFENKHKCGGAILSHEHVITAAHCLTEYGNDYKNLRVYTGCSDSISACGPMFKIDSVHIHPKYKPGNIKTHKYIFRFDIAIIKIKGTIEFNEFQNKIDLPTSPVRVGQDAVVCGWGQYTLDHTEPSVLLRSASMIILDNKDCALGHRFKIGKEQVCAYQQIGVGVCPGDSGSPLVSNGKLIGLASFGIPCGQGLSDIYTRIYMVLDFIRSVVPA